MAKKRNETLCVTAAVHAECEGSVMDVSCVERLLGGEYGPSEAMRRVVRRIIQDVEMWRTEEEWKLSIVLHAARADVDSLVRAGYQLPREKLEVPGAVCFYNWRTTEESEETNG